MLQYEWRVFGLINVVRYGLLFLRWLIWQRILSHESRNTQLKPYNLQSDMFLHPPYPNTSCDMQSELLSTNIHH